MNIRMKGILSSCALIGMGMLASNLAYAAPDVAVEAQYGSLGIGAQIIAPITPDRLRVRFGVNGANLHRDYSDQNTSYSMKMKWDTASAVLDFHPFAGNFRVSGGLYYNNNSFTLSGTSANGYTFNNTQYTSAQAGTVTGKWTFNKTNPYLGIGWGNAVGKDKRLSFSSDFGVLFQGAPHVSLSASNASSNPQLASDIQAQQQKMQDGAKNFKYWPVISFGVAYKF